MGWREMIRWKYGHIAGVHFRQKQLGERGVKWNDLLHIEDEWTHYERHLSR